MATIRLEIYLLLLCCSLNFAIGGDCPASAPTVAIVDKCPTNETEMEKAAQRKKCDMMKGVENCDQPPVYHCLLNQWGNATVEVCTSPWYISGFCTIYNTEQMKVMDDFNRDCTKFSEGKCPSRYHSPEAYMYERCYRIRTSSNPITCHQQSNGSDYKAGLTVLFIIIVLLLVLIIILILERQGRIPKIGLPNWTCTEDIENGNSSKNSKESLKESNNYGMLGTCSEDIENENSTNDFKESRKLLENYDEDRNSDKKSKENVSPREKLEHGLKDDETKMNVQQTIECFKFGSPHKHNQNKHSGYLKREDAKKSERKSEHEEVQDQTLEDAQPHVAGENRDNLLAPHLKQESEKKNEFNGVDDSETLSNLEVCEALCDTFRSISRTKNLNSQKNSALPKVGKGDVDKKHFQNAEETKSADDNNSVNGHDQYTDTDQEKTWETARNYVIDAGSSESSGENEDASSSESSGENEETAGNDINAGSIESSSENEDDLDKPPVEEMGKGIVAKRLEQFQNPNC